MDPVQLLRNYTCEQKPIVFKDAASQVVEDIADAATIHFGDTSLPRHTPTAIKRADAGEPHTLDTLVFLIQHAHLDNYGEYIKECRAHKVEFVSILHKDKMVDYFKGKIDSLPSDIMDNRHGEKRVSAEEPVDQAPGKRVRVVGTDTEEIVKHVLAREKDLQTRSAVMRGSKDFSDFIPTVREVLLGEAPSNGRSTTAAAAAAGKPGASGKSSSQAKPQAKMAKLSGKDKIPIIIVPAAPTAKFTLYNIKQFLEEKRYEDAQKLREQGQKKPDKVTIERRKPNGHTVPYHVVDSVANFKQSDWNRVCCVFVTGAEWQFKGWKWEKPFELFNHIQGFYPKWRSDKRAGAVTNWAVRDINIDVSKRHNDAAVVTAFWDTLDRYNAKQKSYLNY